MTTLDLDRAQPQIRALARALGLERRQVVEALEAYAAIPEADHKPVPPRQIPGEPGKFSRMPFVPAPKFDYVRSDVLMRAYRLIPCQHCGADDGTVCGAHSNASVHGKGRGIKAADVFCASLCHACHSELDQGARLTEEERKDLWWRAHVKTVKTLLQLGHWPADIAAPNVARCPF